MENETMEMTEVQTCENAELACTNVSSTGDVVGDLVKIGVTVLGTVILVKAVKPTCRWVGKKWKEHKAKHELRRPEPKEDEVVDSDMEDCED